MDDLGYGFLNFRGHTLCFHEELCVAADDGLYYGAPSMECRSDRAPSFQPTSYIV